MRLLAVSTMLLLLLGCGAPAPSATPTATPTATTPPATTPATSGPTSEPSGNLGEFECQLPVHIASTAATQTHLTDIRIASHQGYDRIVWEFDTGTPEIDMRQGIPPFTTDPADQPLPVDGNAFLQITFRGASRGGADGPVTYDGSTDFNPLISELVMLRMAGDFEATMTWVAGLWDPACFDLFTLDGPSRVVLDLAGQ